jgi:hypothetical protein
MMKIRANLGTKISEIKLDAGARTSRVRNYEKSAYFD